jgi:hypothetical protein
MIRPFPAARLAPDRRPLLQTPGRVARGALREPPGHIPRHSAGRAGVSGIRTLAPAGPQPDAYFSVELAFFFFVLPNSSENLPETLALTFSPSAIASRT